MKQIVRAFSVGLMTAAIILIGVLYFTDDGTEGQAENSTEELIAQIESDGYRVITEEEYISFSVMNGQKDNEDAEEETAEESDDDSENTPEEQVEEAESEQTEEDEEQSSTPVTITVESGMASSEISDMLEAEGLIDDAREFNRYLIEHDYHLRIQLGDFELEPGMSHYEIAESLTN